MFSHWVVAGGTATLATMAMMTIPVTTSMAGRMSATATVVVKVEQWARKGISTTPVEDSSVSLDSL